jgi:hypothetical protein
MHSLPAVAILALALVGCSAKSSLIQDAEKAARLKGRDFSEAYEVQGIRERAACGRSGGQQAIYREKARFLMLPGDFPPEAWPSLWENWCVLSERL